MAHLPVLLIIIPLAASIICALLRNPLAAWSVTAFATVLNTVIAACLVFQVFADNTLLYTMGGHPAPFGIEYRIDHLSALVVLLITAVAMFTMPYAYRSVGAEIDSKKQPLFYTVFLLCLAGLIGIVATNDLFNLYVFLEISSLATYTLIGLGRDPRALTAAFEYLILGTIGATFILIGVGLLYMMTGTLNITDMTVRLGDVEDMRPVFAAFAFLVIGISLKIAIFPMHMWLTNAYAYAPSFISVFLSATATKVSLYVLIRILYDVFGYEIAFVDMPTGIMLMAIGIVSMVVASLTAIYQENIKRLLAFSSVAQLGYIVLGIGLASSAGLQASLLHIVNHAAAKGLLFLGIGAIYLRVGSARFEHCKGLAKQMPWSCAALLVGGLSLVGIPGTAGFVSKWLLLSALIEQEQWIALVALAISSALAAVYMWKILRTVYLEPLPKKHETITELPVIMRVSFGIFIFLNIYFGLQSGILIDVIDSAALSLIGGVR